ncbi:Repetin [Streptomyces triticagri]|uniref:Repetin n=1 Tax=Streptomyces triticagri TaxID=2293568 RepID=A0A372M194_9ACTN|nr:Repetin [Streptomyces triticagri]
MARTAGVAVLVTTVLVTGGVAGAAAPSEQEAPPVRGEAVAAAAAPHTGDAAALTGRAKLDRPTTEDITFTFDAHLAEKDRMNPSRASGTFRFVHLDKPGGEGGWAEGRIDCLVTGGKVATATGVVTKANRPGLKGTRVGFSVHDVRGQDRLGYSWAAYGTPADQPGELSKCTSAAPFEKVRKGTGDFKVLPWVPDFSAAGGQGAGDER